MIDISPKALRFARMAAEQQSAFSNDPQIAVIRREEDAFTRQAGQNRIGQYVRISEATADFCVRAVASLLEEPERFQSSDWDGNDFVFMQAVRQSLRDQLALSKAPTF